ncbi:MULTISPECIES: flagellar biosynthesis protein FliQ [Carnobacterium]|jgi:flagellar biosynthetic protein FliQ|uniref:Flagellar biosynthetic protein FliQ n=2 Tax=Carnobacterium inhibens TaxID=147709 RepID=U5SE01_9LACT|nr:flagellar biosynthesis protein FliQ [Carnobacterium inhibens]AGY82333.1 flagellar biosynthesis protein FliQ [Carnobacterium inhibens subsp. gilichinskyi]MBC9824475.1 flagellar biosynthesis protein FliQ [Carnobacterium inhibens]MCM3511852.1 flagellar biosynthesis protein FliQ [Carnobacterium inhibens]
MTIVKVLDVIREAFMVMITVAGPTLIIALVVGLIISIIQATTQLQEQTLSFVPKILAVIVSLIVFGNFMLNSLVGFTQKIFEMIAEL